MKTTLLLCTACILGIGASQPAGALPLDFGTSWPSFTAVGVDNYAVGSYSLVIGIAAGQHANPTQVAAVLNPYVNPDFLAADITKWDVGDLLPDATTLGELDPPDGYFLVPAGWTYLVAQYDGPNGGSVIIKLDGSSAKVPWDSSAIWGAGDKYAISHISVAGRQEIPPVDVPDGGATAVLLGLSLLGMGLSLRRKA